MPNHHTVFHHFCPFSGRVPAGYGFDFLGTRIRSQFVAGLYTYPANTFLETSYPAVDEEYFEWIDVLESVIAARGSYTMIDLGAGFGRWAVRAAYALKQSQARLPFRLIAVEPEPVVYQWMHSHFRDNEIDPSRHSLIHAAACTVEKEVPFYIGGPPGGPYDRTPDAWYGQRIVKDYDLAGGHDKDGLYNGFRVFCYKSNWRGIRVPAVTLTGLLKDQDLVDLVNMDIEAQEFLVIQSAIEELDAKAKRIHIGTHSRDIESGLRQLLTSHGWRCLNDYSIHTTSETPFGAIRFENGVQSWVNPRL
jgi:FkbM family methyltransferase